MQDIDGSIYKYSLARTVLQGNSLGVRGNGAPSEGRRTMQDQPGDVPTPPWPMPMHADNVEGNDYAGIYRKTSMQRNAFRLFGGAAPSTEAALASYESVSGFGFDLQDVYDLGKSIGGGGAPDEPPPPTIQKGTDPIVAWADPAKTGGGGGGTAKAKAVPNPSANVPPSGAPPKQAGIFSNPLYWVGVVVVVGGGYMLYKKSKKTQYAANRRRARRSH